MKYHKYSVYNSDAAAFSVDSDDGDDGDGYLLEKQ